MTISNSRLISDKSYIDSLDDYVGIVLDSRLGNMMFQIAAGITIADRYKKKFVAVLDSSKRITSNSETQHCEFFSQNIFKKIEILTEFPSNCVIAQDNPPFNLYRELPYKKNILYKGYFQSEKYFAENKSNIVNLFSIPEYIKDAIQCNYGNVSEFTSIHVRRGDYVNDLPRFDTLTAQFFQTCIERISEKDANYLIVSDDIQWCKTNLDFIQNKVFADKQIKGFQALDYTLIDLYIQTLCRNNITSNSTFSWWGAWLNCNSNKKVTIPFPWFANNYFLNNFAADLYPKEWIVVNKYAK